MTEKPLLRPKIPTYHYTFKCTCLKSHCSNTVIFKYRQNAIMKRRLTRRGGQASAKRRRINRQVAGINRVPYVYQETGASRIPAGSTTLVTVPDNLPINRSFRPTLMRVQFIAAQAAGCVAQVRALGPDQQTIAVYGPICVGLTSRTLVCRYPSSADNFPETTPKTQPMWAVDHICLKANSTDAILITNSTIWNFSREYQAENCPARIYLSHSHAHASGSITSDEPSILELPDADMQ